MRDAGGEMTCALMVCGRDVARPGTVATARTVTMPRAPPCRTLALSTVPSKLPPKNRIVAPGTGWPALSSASPRSRTVSPATTMGFAGVTRIRATGLGWGCWKSRVAAARRNMGRRLRSDDGEGEPLNCTQEPRDAREARGLREATGGYGK